MPVRAVDALRKEREVALPYQTPFVDGVPVDGGIIVWTPREEIYAWW